MNTANLVLKTGVMSEPWKLFEALGADFGGSERCAGALDQVFTGDKKRSRGAPLSYGCAYPSISR